MLKDYLRAFNDLYGDAEAYLSNEEFRIWRDHAANRVASGVFDVEAEYVPVKTPEILIFDRRPWK